MDGSDDTALAGVEAVVDLDAVDHNTRLLNECAGDAGLMAVVKADAYGHGLVPIARTVLAAGADQLGVTTIDEALRLREAGVIAPVLAWMLTPAAPFAAALRADIDLGVSSSQQLEAVVRAAHETGRTARITPKLDTGLGRGGIAPAELPATLAALARAEAAESIHVTGLFAHFAHADEPRHPTIDAQAAALREAIAAARRAGLRPEINHHANSAATLTRPDLAFDMVRPGVALFGLDPMEDGADRGLRPAMTLRAPVMLVKPIAAGQGVSYGHTWHAPRDTVIGVIPAGYADGVPRGLGNRLRVRIGDRLFPGVGRVCMDQFVVDLGPAGAGVREGDEAVLFGPGDDGGPTASDWARMVGTIHYEIVTGVRGRTRRIHRGGMR